MPRNYKLATLKTLNYMWRFRIKTRIEGKANINHTHNTINGYTIQKSIYVPTTTDNTIITLYEPVETNNSSANRSVAANVVANAKKTISYPILLVEEYEDSVTLESEEFIPLTDRSEESVQTVVEVTEPEISEVEKRLQDDPFDEEFIESLLIDGPAVTIDDLHLLTYWSLTCAVSTGKEYGDYTLSLSAFYKDEDGAFQTPEDVEYQIERVDNSIIHSRTSSTSFKQILNPCTRINIRVFFDDEDSVSDYKVPDIAFPIVNIQRNGVPVGKLSANSERSYSSLAWDIYRGDLNNLQFTFTKPDKYDNQIYKDMSVYNIRNVGEVLTRTYKSVQDMIDVLDIDDYGLWNSLYTTSDGVPVFEVSREYISDDVQDLYYLVKLVTVDDVELNMIVELHII